MTSRPQVRGHFIDGPAGSLAAVVWRPPVGEPVRFGVLHVPAAGDELNKSRHVAALQARELAARGALVALIDLRGTGDSAGEHREATWDGWRADVEAAWTWLQRLIAPSPGVLWGLRLGSLLAADVIASGRMRPAALLLWQPVVAGRAHFNQWLRAANAQITGRDSGPEAMAPRAMLARGLPIEVAGYELNPALVSGAEAVDMSMLPPPPCPVVLRETTIARPPVVSPSAAKVQAAWRRDRALLDFAAVTGPSFWASQELAEAPELVEASTAALVSCLAGAGSID